MTRWRLVGFLRRDNSDGLPPSAGSAGTGGHVGIGRGEVGECAQMVIEGLRDAPIGRETLELLQVGLPYLIQRDCSDETVVAGQTAARLGYLSRSVEFVRYEAARIEDDELYEALAERFDAAEAQGESLYDAMADLAAAMASDVPAGTRRAGGGRQAVGVVAAQEAHQAPSCHVRGLTSSRFRQSSQQVAGRRHPRARYSSVAPPS